MAPARAVKLGRESTTKRNKLKVNDMSKRSVFCLAASQDEADEIVERLRNDGVSGDDISALFPDNGRTRDFAFEKNTKAPEGLVIPGVGPITIAGPMVAALSGAPIGAVVVGISGVLIGMGIPEYVAKRYEDKVKSAKILISVHCETSDRVKRVKEILETVGAQDIASTGESSAPEGKWRPTTTDYAQAETYLSV